MVTSWTNFIINITMFKHLFMGLCAVYLMPLCTGDICATCLCSNTSIGATIDCHEKQLASNDMLNSDLLLLDEHQTLNKLIFSKNEIVQLPAHLLTKLKLLKSLDLSENLLTEIHVNTFADLSNLAELDLSNNRIEIFDTVLLKTLSALSSINLSHNDVKSVESTINMTGKLSHLDLSYNDITELSNGLFKSLGNLRTLNLSFNKINYIANDSFLQLQLLATLYLQNNALNSVDFRIFPTSLTELNCGFNKITNIHYDDSGIRKLNLEGNNFTDLPKDLSKIAQLQYLNISLNNLNNFPSIKLEDLQTLDIANNKLVNIPDSLSSSNLPQLENLNISGNPMKTLIFPSNLALKTFRATNMMFLESIEENAMKNLASPNGCLNITISNNENLRAIHENCLKHLQICSLDLSNNKFTSLSSKLISLESDFKTYRVNLQGNPFNCNCTLQWILNDLIPKLYRNQRELLDDFRCKTPLPISNMRMIHWYGWKDEVFCTDTNHLKENYILPKVETETEVITFESSAGMFAVIGTTLGILTLLIIIGLLLSRRLYIKRRRSNRRF